VSDARDIVATIQALYECISGPAGAPRDWARFRSLLFPGARLVRTSVDPDGRPQTRAMDAAAYEADTAAVFREGPFYEAEVAHRIERFGNIAHVLSVYEARRAPDDAVPFKRGVNSIQLCWDGSRWQVVSVLWDNERDGNPIPAEYLRPSVGPPAPGS
jgi:hypothetical protein